MIFSCDVRIRQELISRIEEQDSKIQQLKYVASASKTKINELEDQNAILLQEIDFLKRRLKVYDAFFKDGTGTLDFEEIQQADENDESDYHRLAKLRTLSSLSSRHDVVSPRRSDESKASHK